MKKYVLIINISKRPSSIWLYSRNLMRIDENRIKVIDTFVNSNRLTREIMLSSDVWIRTNFIQRKIRGLEYDILHYDHPNIPPINNNKIGKPQVVTIYDNPNILINSDYYESDSVLGRIEKKYMKRTFDSYKNFDHILTETNYVKNSLIDYGFSGEIETIYLPVSPFFRHIEDKASLRKKLDLPIDKKLILSISTTYKRKNLQIIERAMKLLDKNYKLVRVGKQLDNSITFSNVDNETLNMIYNACDVLVFPSLEEGQGLPIIEAFATGLPVVASDIEVFHEAGGEAVEFVNPYNVDSLVTGIQNALALSDTRIQLGKKVIQNFSFEIFRQKMLRYYEKISEDS